MALALGEGVESRDPPGALCVDTGAYTGRSPHDRYIECRPGSVWERDIDWNEVNQPIAPERRQPPEGAGGDRAGLAPRVRDEHVYPAGQSGRARGIRRARLYHRQRLPLAQPAVPSDGTAFGRVYRAVVGEAAGPDWRHAV
eukprot:ctg_126.g66